MLSDIIPLEQTLEKTKSFQDYAKVVHVMQRQTRKNKKYSPELRLQAVEDYLFGKGTIKQIRKKHGLLANKQLINRIK